MRDVTDTNRRSILKSIGGMGVGLPALSSVASASEWIPDGDYRLLTGGNKRRLAAELARTPEFRTLARLASQRGQRVPDPDRQSGDRRRLATATASDDIRAGRARTADETREVVEYQMRALDEADRASIVIGRDADSGEVTIAWLDYYFETDDGILSEVHRIDAAGGTVSAASADDAFDVIDVDDELVRAARERVEHSGSVTATQSWSCSGCNYAVGTVCTTGCGAVGGFLCGFFGITVPVAGLSCLTFIGIVCTVADHHSGCGSAVADEVCDDRIGVC